MNARSDETTVILCYGNPARGDDGLGPAAARTLEHLDFAHTQVESNYQLVVEDAAAIADSSLVLFVDAAIEGEEPYAFRRLVEREELGYMAHSIDAEGLLGLTRATFGRCPPAYALAIRGYSFEMFEEGLTPRAGANLAEALTFLTGLLQDASGALPLLRAGKWSRRSRAADGHTGARELTSGGMK